MLHTAEPLGDPEQKLTAIVGRQSNEEWLPASSLLKQRYEFFFTINR
jgi:hypothetical protein